jgi:hypothetical protein
VGPGGGGLAAFREAETIGWPRETEAIEAERRCGGKESASAAPDRDTNGHLLNKESNMAKKKSKGGKGTKGGY